MVESLPWMISTFAVLAVLVMVVWNMWKHPKHTPSVLPDPDIETRSQAVKDAMSGDSPEEALSKVLNGN